MKFNDKKFKKCCKGSKNLLNMQILVLISLSLERSLAELVYESVWV